LERIRAAVGEAAEIVLPPLAVAGVPCSRWCQLGQLACKSSLYPATRQSAEQRRRCEKASLRFTHTQASYRPPSSDAARPLHKSDKLSGRHSARLCSISRELRACGAHCTPSHLCPHQPSLLGRQRHLRGGWTGVGQQA